MESLNPDPRGHEPERRPGWSRIAGILAATWICACASTPVVGPPLDEFEAAERKGDIIRFTGIAPTRCTWSRPGHEICTWRLANRNRAWWTLAPTVDTEYPVNLVCEFASDGSPSPGACGVYPRKSRPLAALPSVAAAEPAAASGPGADRSGRAVEPATTAESAEAQQGLDAAGTVRQVSELVGDAPDYCAAVDERSQQCVWNGSHQSLGYEILAATIGTSGRVRLSCSFPSDGSARAPGSCRVAIP